MGILYLFTFGLFGIGWIVDTIITLRNLLKPNNQQQINNPYINSLYSEMNQQFVYNSAARDNIDKYYKGMEEIESMWSVMYNLKIINNR